MKIIFFLKKFVHISAPNGKIEIGLNSQGCCLRSARSQETPTVPGLRFILGRPKFQTGSPNGRLKRIILRLTSGEQTRKFPVHSALLKRKRKTFSCQTYAKKYFRRQKANKQALVLRFASVTSAAAQFKFLA